MVWSRVQRLLEDDCGREALGLHLETISNKMTKYIPRAVPQDVVASEPVLQMVIIVNFFLESSDKLII